MPTKENALTMMRKRTGKDAARILDKVDRMLKQGMGRGKIEEAVAVELCAHLRAEMRIIGNFNNPHPKPR